MVLLGLIFSWWMSSLVWAVLWGFRRTSGAIPDPPWLPPASPVPPLRAIAHWHLHEAKLCVPEFRPRVRAVAVQLVLELRANFRGHSRPAPVASGLTNGPHACHAIMAHVLDIFPNLDLGFRGTCLFLKRSTQGLMGYPCTKGS